MEIKGTKTENNLRSAISGESQAALLYEYFAEKAKRDGFEAVADVFRETARNERAHAKIYLDMLECISTTEKNLLASAETEHHENSVMYPEFAECAKEEGLSNVAATFEMVGKIESEHEARFRLLQNQIQNNAFFTKGEKVTWICKNCGHRIQSNEAPEICPVCKHPKSYFDVLRSL